MAYSGNGGGYWNVGSSGFQEDPAYTGHHAASDFFGSEWDVDESHYLEEYPLREPYQAGDPALSAAEDSAWADDNSGIRDPYTSTEPDQPGNPAPSAAEGSDWGTETTDISAEYQNAVPILDDAENTPKARKAKAKNKGNHSKSRTYRSQSGRTFATKTETAGSPPDGEPRLPGDPRLTEEHTTATMDISPPRDAHPASRKSYRNHFQKAEPSNVMGHFEGESNTGQAKYDYQRLDGKPLAPGDVSKKERNSDKWATEDVGHTDPIHMAWNQPRANKQTTTPQERRKHRTAEKKSDAAVAAAAKDKEEREAAAAASAAYGNDFDPEYYF